MSRPNENQQPPSLADDEPAPHQCGYARCHSHTHPHSQLGLCHWHDAQAKRILRSTHAV